MSIYILQKDCLDAKAGDRFLYSDISDSYSKIDGDCELDYTSKCYVENNPEWFLKEEPKQEDKKISVRVYPIEQAKGTDGYYKQSIHTSKRISSQEAYDKIEVAIENALNDKYNLLGTAMCYLNAFIDLTSKGISPDRTGEDAKELVKYYELLYHKKSEESIPKHSGSINKKIVDTESKEFLFISEDGIKIHKGDHAYLLSTSDWLIAQITAPHIPFHGENKEFKYFSSKEAAIEYRDQMKPKYSLMDLRSVKGKTEYTTIEHVIEQLKNKKLGL